MYEALEDKSSTQKNSHSIKEALKNKVLEGKEDALFSKILATIRRDAPIEFTMDSSVWDMKAHKDSILAICKEFEFRSMIARFSSDNPSTYSSVGSGTGKVKVQYEDSVSIDDGYDSAHLPRKNSKKSKDGEESQEDAGKVVSEQSNSLFAQEYSKSDQLLLKKAGIGLWLIDSTYTNPNTEEILTATNTNSPQQAYDNIVAQLKSKELFTLYSIIEEPLIPIIDSMKEHGVAIDVNKLAILSKKLHKKLTELSSQIYITAGEEFNINSPKQLGKILYETLSLGGKVKKTATGAKSTNEAELQKIKDEHAIIPLILEYRELQKLSSTYVDTLPTLVGKDGRLHADFVQNGAATGRMSSQNPNLQNIPIKTEQGREIRESFIASKGKVLVECDYSQIELRVAAFLSEDEKLMDIFKHGRDVHTEVASQVFGVDPNAVTKDMRRKAKVINFGILYGMGVNALKANLGTSRDEAKAFYDAYFKTFTGLANYLDQVVIDARKKGYTETLMGRRRYMPGLKSPFPQLRAQAERMAINAPIQGTASDLIKMAMKEVFAIVCNSGSSKEVAMVMQIHDSLVFEMDKHKVQNFVPQILTIMKTQFSKEQTKGVPIEVNAAYGPHWGDLEDFKQ
jgi:DNA polymerase I